MPLFNSTPFEDLVAKMTSEQNVTEDWSLIMDICDKVVNYEEGPKYCLQAIGKRLYHKVPRVVMQALVLLDACVKNCGKKFHLEISSRYFIEQLPKLLPKMHDATSSYLKQLIRKWSENDFKDDPELCLLPSLYYKLKSEGVEFPAEPEEDKKKPPISTDPNVVSSQEEEEDIIKAIALSLNQTTQPYTQGISEERSSETSSYSSAAEICKVRALYDFDAVEDNELTIKAGEIIIITDKSNSSWWKGSNHRGDGFFPANFTTQDLDAPIAETNVKEKDESETLPKQIDDETDDVTVIDEVKIQQTLDWLNELDPTLDLEDPTDLISNEKQCHSMSSLIEEKLQDIDKRCTLLNVLNEELMDAVHLFYSLNSGAKNSISRLESPSMKTLSTKPNKQQFIPPQYYMLNEGANPLSSVPSSSSQPVFVPVCTQSSQIVSQYPVGLSSCMPNVCYSPVMTLPSKPKFDIFDNKSVPAAMMGGNMSSMDVNSMPTMDETSKQRLSDQGFQNKGAAPMMYQTVFIPQQLDMQNSSFFTHYGSLPFQQPDPRFAHPQLNMPIKGYIPNYVAQVITPNADPANRNATQITRQTYSNPVGFSEQSSDKTFTHIKNENQDSDTGSEKFAESKNP